ncbi:RNaseH domain-containing protein [Streptomyces sp. G7(2002)]|uniref:RNaseH domain-containing protein n=1 Tax=Streptomyces sp. G7(2002) TaxID=2971798 RepID=UPI00237D3DCA|nr:RNaseH domain-containing protein [Streptomyces sp. G7(2002)]WDT58461.1 RNAseH domain-containing protein [Streptomyces sp. G7(2002)]
MSALDIPGPSAALTPCRRAPAFLLQRKDWHSFTAAQIAVPHAGERDPQRLAALAAQLWHQPLAWDARTRHPFPLHVAGAMDRAHPEYRGPSIEPTVTPEPDETQDDV